MPDGPAEAFGQTVPPFGETAGADRKDPVDGIVSTPTAVDGVRGVEGEATGTVTLAG